MNKTTFTNTQNTGSKLNSTTLIVLVLAMLPVLFFALTKMVPPVDASTAKKTAIEESESKRVSAAERRAQRAEARKAKKAEKTATASVQSGAASFPMPPMEPMEFNGGFGPGMGFDNGMAMGPGGFGGGMGPGMGFGGGFGPGMGMF